MSANHKTPPATKFRRLFGYGVGDFGLNIYWQSVSMFLVYWYTQIAGLDPRIAGALFFTGMVWDAISDPIVSSLSERVNTKMGTYRPFILYGCGFTALTFTLLFWIPSIDGAVKIGVFICAALMFRTSYTIVAVPYAAMGSRITYDSSERADYSGARMFFAFLALLIVSMLLWPSIEYFEAMTQSEELAFQITAAIGGIVATLALLVCFLMTREKPLPEQYVQSTKIWSGIWLTVKQNRAFKHFIPIVFLNTAGTSTLWITLIFYIEANGSMFAPKEVLFSSFALATLVMIPIWTYFIKLWGRKKIWIAAAVLYSLVAAHLLVFSDFVIAGVPVQLLLFMALMGAHAIIFWAFVPDCVEFGQQESGIRSEAGVYGTVLITQKVTGGVSGLVVGFALSWFGLTETIVPTENLARDLRLFIIIFPTAMILLSIIPIALLNMNRDKHGQIIGDLSVRQNEKG